MVGFYHISSAKLIPYSYLARAAADAIQNRILMTVHLNTTRVRASHVHILTTNKLKAA